LLNFSGILLVEIIATVNDQKLSLSRVILRALDSSSR